MTKSLNFLERKTPWSSDFIVLCTAFFLFCVHMQILILYGNQNVLLTLKRSAKNIKDELEPHKLFPLLTTGERCGCHGDVQLDRINGSSSRASAHHQPCARRSCSAEQTSWATPRSATDPNPRKAVGPCDRESVTCCSQQKGAADPAFCPGGDPLQLLRWWDLAVHHANTFTRFPGTD